MTKKKTDEEKITYTVTFNKNENDYLLDRAEKRGKTPEEQIQDATLGKAGNKRKKDIDIQRGLVNLTELCVSLQQNVLENKPSTELLTTIDSISKEVLTLCQC